MKVRIDPGAEAETWEAAQWYENHRSGLGLEFLAAVDNSIQRIGRAPGQYLRLETVAEEASVRRLLLDRFPLRCHLRIGPRRGPRSGGGTYTTPARLLATSYVKTAS